MQKYTWMYVATCICVLVSVAVYYGLQPASVTFHIRSTYVDYHPDEVFQFVKDPSHLPDICYSVLAVKIINCENHQQDEEILFDECHFNVIQNFMHIGSQTVYVNSFAFPRNYTITMFHILFNHIVYVNSEYVIRAATKADVIIDASAIDSTTGAYVDVSGTIVAPKLLLSYANRTLVELHDSILDSIQTAMSVRTA